MGDVVVEDMLSRLQVCSVEELCALTYLRFVGCEHVSTDKDGHRQYFLPLHGTSFLSRWIRGDQSCFVFKIEWTMNTRDLSRRRVSVYGGDNVGREGWCVLSSNLKTFIDGRDNVLVPRVRFQGISRSGLWICNSFENA